MYLCSHIYLSSRLHSLCCPFINLSNFLLLAFIFLASFLQEHHFHFALPTYSVAPSRPTPPHSLSCFTSIATLVWPFLCQLICCHFAMYETTWALGICYGSLTSTCLPPSFTPPSALQHLLLTYVHALYIDQNSICAAFLTTFKAERTSRQKKEKRKN